MRRFTISSELTTIKKTQSPRKKVSLESWICKSKKLKTKEIPKPLICSEANNQLFRTSICSSKCSLTLFKTKPDNLPTLKLINQWALEAVWWEILMQLWFNNRWWLLNIREWLCRIKPKCCNKELNSFNLVRSRTEWWPPHLLPVLRPLPSRALKLPLFIQVEEWVKPFSNLRAILPQLRCPLQPVEWWLLWDSHQWWCNLLWWCRTPWLCNSRPWLMLRCSRWKCNSRAWCTQEWVLHHHWPWPTVA